MRAYCLKLGVTALAVAPARTQDEIQQAIASLASNHTSRAEHVKEVNHAFGLSSGGQALQNGSKITPRPSENHATAVDQRLDALGAEIAKSNKKLDAHSSQLATVDRKLDALLKRLGPAPPGPGPQPVSPGPPLDLSSRVPASRPSKEEPESSQISKDNEEAAPRVLSSGIPQLSRSVGDLEA